MATTQTLTRKAAAAAQDRDVCIRQRQDAEEQLLTIARQMAKAKPETLGDLMAEYARARNTVDALTAATDLLSTWADDAWVAVVEAVREEMEELKETLGITPAEAI